MTEMLNASQPARLFYVRHMQPGVCRYDTDTVLVDTDCLKKMVATGNGLAVYIDHQPNDLETQEQRACGYIVESFYNELDGWAWFKIIITKDEGHAAIADGWKVSNAYKGTAFGGAGKKNNVPYAREFLDGFFTHLALVPIPRYEKAEVFTPEKFKEYQENLKRNLEELKNSITPKGKPAMSKTSLNPFKLFKTTREETNTLDADTIVQLADGTEITVEEMLNSVKKNAIVEEMENGDMEVDTGDGEKMPLKELVNKYNAMKKNSKTSKKNSSLEEEELELQENKNAEEEEKKKTEKEAEEKKNALAAKGGVDHFEEMLNAHKKEMAAPAKIEAPQNGIARGMARYGKPKTA